MARHIIFLAVVPLLIVLFVGCSSDNMNPLMPAEYSNASSIFPQDADENETNRSFYGSWEFEFNTYTLTADLIEDRSVSAHYNVTDLIAPPSIVVNSYNPANHILDIDVTITNPSLIDVYDVRLIVYSNKTGHLLLNPDNWTTLWNMPDGNLINPFKAYVEGESNRRFESHQSYSENLQIYLPQGNTNVQFAVDASYPGNCEIPYQITNYSQETIYSLSGSVGLLEIDVYDWQDDVSEVFLHCPDVTGDQFTSLNQSNSTTWKLYLENIGAPSGEYPAYIIAKSSNSGNLMLVEPVIINISPGGVPNDPHVVKQFCKMFECRDISILGNYAYVADDIGGFKIVDIADPQNPKVSGSMTFTDTNNAAIAVTMSAVKGNHAYISGTDMDLLVIDVTDPGNPVEVNNLAFHNVCDIEFSENSAFVVCGEDLHIFDISNPIYPEEYAGVSFNYQISDLEVSGDHAFVAISDTLYSLDISSLPIIEVDGLLNSTDQNKIEIQGNYLYLSDTAEGLLVVDISDTSNMFIQSTLEIESPAEMVIQNDTAYLLDELNNLYMIDINVNPGNPQIIDTYILNDSNDIAVLDNLVFVADGIAGLSVIDCTNPVQPIRISVLESFVPTSIRIKGDYGYVLRRNIDSDSFGANGLTIVGLQNTSNPVFLGDIETRPPSNIDVKGDYAYLIVDANPDFPGDEGLRVIDLSDRNNPVMIASVGVFNAKDISILGHYAYIAAMNDGLIVVDISNPSNPVQAASCDIPNAQSVAINDFYTYIGTSNGKIVVVDTGIPTNPVIIGSESFSGNFNSISLQTSYAYVNALGDGMYIFDLSNPAAPVLLSVFNQDGSNDLTVLGDYAYLAYVEPVTADCMHIIDISNPINPEIMSTIVTDAPSMGIALKDNYAYLTEGRAGITIIQLW